MSECVFCKIVKKEIPADVIHETDSFIVFEDIKPSAPTHLLIVPKKHFKDITELPDDLWVKAKKIALEMAKDYDGFRLVVNSGKAVMVEHFHMHLLTGIKSTRKV